MNGFSPVLVVIIIALLVILALSTLGLLVTLALYFKKIYRAAKRLRKKEQNTPLSAASKMKQIPPQKFLVSSSAGRGDIRNYGINEIRSSGRFSAAERKLEYRRRGKSPSGVIDGIYNDEFRGNDSYNDMYRDWDADA